MVGSSPTKQDVFGQQDGSHHCTALLSPSCPLSFVARYQQCCHVYLSIIQMLLSTPKFQLVSS